MTIILIRNSDDVSYFRTDIFYVYIMDVLLFTIYIYYIQTGGSATDITVRLQQQTVNIVIKSTWPILL